MRSIGLTLVFTKLYQIWLSQCAEKCMNLLYVITMYFCFNKVFVDAFSMYTLILFTYIMLSASMKFYCGKFLSRDSGLCSTFLYKCYSHTISDEFFSHSASNSILYFVNSINVCD